MPVWPSQLSGFHPRSWQREHEKYRGVLTCAKHRDLYHGALRDGKPCGFGYISIGAPGYHHEWANKAGEWMYAEEFEGRFGASGVPDGGLGRYQFCSGDVYVGPFAGGKFSGGVGWFRRGPHPNDVFQHITFKEKLVLRRHSNAALSAARALIPPEPARRVFRTCSKAA